MTPDLDKPDFSLVIPFHNEEENIRPVITQIVKVLENKNLNYELLAVDNHSSDKTGSIITELANGNKRIRKVFVKELGYGNAVRGGLKLAQGKWIGWTDGDQQIAPFDVYRVMKKTLETNAIFCKAERRIRYDGIFRMLFTLMYRTFISILSIKPIYDVNGKPKFFRKSWYNKIILASNGWFIDAEIVMKFLDLGAKIFNVPTTFLERKKGKSSVNTKTVLRLIREIRNFMGI